MPGLAPQHGARAPAPAAGAQEAKTVRDVYNLMYRDQRREGGAYLLLNATGSIGSSGGRRAAETLKDAPEHARFGAWWHGKCCVAQASRMLPLQHQRPRRPPRAARAPISRVPGPRDADSDAPLIHLGDFLAAAAAGAGGAGAGAGAPEGEWVVLVPVAESNAFLSRLAGDEQLQARVKGVLVDDTGAAPLGPVEIAAYRHAPPLVLRA